MLIFIIYGIVCIIFSLNCFIFHNKLKLNRKENICWLETRHIWQIKPKKEILCSVSDIKNASIYYHHVKSLVYLYRTRLHLRNGDTLEISSDPIYQKKFAEEQVQKINAFLNNNKPAISINNAFGDYIKGGIVALIMGVVCLFLPLSIVISKGYSIIRNDIDFETYASFNNILILFLILALLAFLVYYCFHFKSFKFDKLHDTCWIEYFIPFFPPRKKTICHLSDIKKADISYFYAITDIEIKSMIKRDLRKSLKEKTALILKNGEKIDIIYNEYSARKNVNKINYFLKHGTGTLVLREYVAFVTIIVLLVFISIHYLSAFLSDFSDFS